MKKLLAIICICALFAPTAGRLYIYMQCTLQAATGQDCDCNLQATPTDQSAQLPDKQKEILQQTEVKFIAVETGYHFGLATSAVTYAGYIPSVYKFLYSSSVFHPPGSFIS